MQAPQIPAEGHNDPLQGKEPLVFDENRLKTDEFLHELQLYQFVNELHPIMQNPWCKVVHTLTYLTEPNTYKWKQSVENWIMSIPVPTLPTHTIYDEFEEEFIQSWTNMNEPYHTAAELDKLCINHDDIDT